MADLPDAYDNLIEEIRTTLGPEIAERGQKFADQLVTFGRMVEIARTLFATIRLAEHAGMRSSDWADQTIATSLSCLLVAYRALIAASSEPALFEAMAEPVLATVSRDAVALAQWIEDAKTDRIIAKALAAQRDKFRRDPEALEALYEIEFQINTRGKALIEAVPECGAA